MGVVSPGEHDTDTDSGFGGNPKNARDGVVVDAVWGEIRADGPNYRNLGWYVLSPTPCHSSPW